MTKIEPIEAQDPDLINLLRAEKLPTQDLSGDSKHYFCIRNIQGQLVAAGGLEICGSSAILRSCVVAPSLKGQGIGIQLINDIIDSARQMQLEQLFLLTETASGFFPKLGFREIDRNAVPRRIAVSAQFADICPQSAVAMKLRLPAWSEPDSPASDG